MSCMSLQVADSAQLTTREVAALTGRTQSAVRVALGRGDLPGSRPRDKWLVKRDDALAWNTRTRVISRRSSQPWNRAAEMLAEFGAMTAEELARLVELNSGNARKHLAILAKEGRAQRLSDGQWVLINKHAGAA
jgi:predicted transcriptional regulator of viral defense system